MQTERFFKHLYLRSLRGILNEVLGSEKKQFGEKKSNDAIPALTGARNKNDITG